MSTPEQRTTVRGLRAAAGAAYLAAAEALVAARVAAVLSDELA
ncbi:hypothetical protein [Azohydromonas sp.]|nr:hypothetical protein [Azohydromonas sp.]HMM87067.1 hypothetical protein [Azohydromonas sp.]